MAQPPTPDHAGGAAFGRVDRSGRVGVLRARAGADPSQHGPALQPLAVEPPDRCVAAVRGPAAGVPGPEAIRGAGHNAAVGRLLRGALVAGLPAAVCGGLEGPAVPERQLRVQGLPGRVGFRSAAVEWSRGDLAG